MILSHLARERDSVIGCDGRRLSGITRNIQKLHVHSTAVWLWLFHFVVSASDEDRRSGGAQQKPSPRSPASSKEVKRLTNTRAASPKGGPLHCSFQKVVLIMALFFVDPERSVKKRAQRQKRAPPCREGEGTPLSGSTPLRYVCEWMPALASSATKEESPSHQNSLNEEITLRADKTFKDWSAGIGSCREYISPSRFGCHYLFQVGRRVFFFPMKGSPRL